MENKSRTRYELSQDKESHYNNKVSSLNLKYFHKNIDFIAKKY